MLFLPDSLSGAGSEIQKGDGSVGTDGIRKGMAAYCFPSFFKRARTAPVRRFNVTAISLAGTPFWCKSSKMLSCSGDQGCPSFSTLRF